MTKAEMDLLIREVNHRLASYAQESTRYCNCNKDGFYND